MDSDDAYITVRLMKTPLCFVGHSHAPAIFHSALDKMARINGWKTRIEPDEKYVVNIGSVGQPRDGDPRASYAIYDTGEGTVEIRRVDYDIQKAKEKILKAGLPPYLAHRLSEGR